jgi:hypothetical protein
VSSRDRYAGHPRTLPVLWIAYKYSARQSEVLTPQNFHFFRLIVRADLLSAGARKDSHVRRCAQWVEMNEDEVYLEGVCQNVPNAAVSCAYLSDCVSQSITCVFSKKHRFDGSRNPMNSGTWRSISPHLARFTSRRGPRGPRPSQSRTCATDACGSS